MFPVIKGDRYSGRGGPPAAPVFGTQVKAKLENTRYQGTKTLQVAGVASYYIVFNLFRLQILTWEGDLLSDKSTAVSSLTLL